MRNTLWVILSWSKGRKHSDKLKRQLVDGGIPGQSVKTCYGFKYGLKQNGVAIVKGITSLSFRYRWLRRVAALLYPRSRYAAVVYLESNARVEVEVEDVVRRISTSRTPVVWAGYKKKGKWNTIEGAKAIAFKRSGLQLAHAAMGRSKVGSYCDGVLTRGLAGHIDLPEHTMFSTREHWSVSEGKLLPRVLRKPSTGCWLPRWRPPNS